ncbi:MAG: 2,4-dihydroxyhept-2-ene-1,7-dioic acid aldolase [Nitrospirae bacterium]|nr:2,4-dihydroxyhept-2-ene-1,7-dioic acid aldolase [Nitrospirota bacterium]MBF0553599.1 2,4-dihydroxyhept-2-ene-1,7-dioic acid aldolase [Nitrospirota bacterium]
MKKLKELLTNNKPTIGSWLTIGHVSVAEVMSQRGYDWLTIDMEHSAITLHELLPLIVAIEACGVVPLVRVGENSICLIKRVMDIGAHGVIVPMVNTQEDAVKAVQAVKYPPYGSRGVGLTRAQEYGFGFERYKDWVYTDSVVIVQIEHIEAVHNLEEILSVEGVDGSIIGPYDLSGSLGKPGDFENLDVIHAINHYERVCAMMKKPMGFHVVQPNHMEAQKYLDKGYIFLAVGVDFLYLGKKCSEVLVQLGKRLI